MMERSTLKKNKTLLDIMPHTCSKPLQLAETARVKKKKWREENQDSYCIIVDRSRLIVSSVSGVDQSSNEK